MNRIKLRKLMKNPFLLGKSSLEREIRLTSDCDMVKRLRSWSQECYVSINDDMCVRSVLHYTLYIFDICTYICACNYMHDCWCDIS